MDTQPVVAGGLRAAPALRPPRSNLLMVLALFAAACAPLARAASAGVDAIAPDDVDVSAELAAAAMDLSDGDARAALRRLVRVAEVEPDNPWMHYYRGAALLMLRRPYDALDSFDAATDRLAALGDPDPDLRRRIAEHRVLARRQVFNIDLDMGLAYDTNVTFTGAGGQDFGFISGRSDGVFGTRMQAGFAPVANQSDVIAVGLRTAHTWHFRVEEFDFQDYGALLRYAHRWDDHWETSATYVYDFSVLDRQSYLSQHALGFGLDYHWAYRNARMRAQRTGVFYRIAAQDFLFPTPRELDRDGIAHAVGVEQALRVQPLADVPWTWDVSAGYAFESVHTEGDEFDRHGHEFFLRCGMPLLNPADPSKYLLLPDKEARLEFDAMWELDRYRRPGLFDRNRRHRRDFITTLALRLSQLLQKDPQYGDLTVHAIVAWTDSDSNVRTRDGGAPFSYDRVFYGLQIAWSW